MPTKIATCCFCGSKTALRLDQGRHELVCGSCGAPLRDMKSVPVAQPKKAVSHQPALRAFPTAKPERKVKKKKMKKRKSLFAKFAEEAFDVIEDIFD